jgi:hypothetical protein
MTILRILLPLFATSTTLLAQSEYQPVDVRPLRDKVSVRLGQTVSFVFEQHGQRLVNPRPAGPSEKRPNLTLKLEYQAKGGYATLFINSTFPKTLVYRDAALFDGRSGFVTTRTHPAFPNVLDAEAFPGRIKECVLWDLRLTNERP